jgi:Holliday junction resolvase-like predicted endonuclease
VDSDKQVDLSRMARDFLRHLPGASECEWRFDILSVYYDGSRRQPAFELFQNAFSPAYNRGFARLRRENRR